MEGQDVNAVAKDDAVEGLPLMTSGKVQHISPIFQRLTTTLLILLAYTAN